MPELYVFNLDFCQLVYAGSRCCEETDDEVPGSLAVSFQGVLKMGIVGLADYIFRKWFLLHPYEFQFPLFFSDAFQITVYRAQPQVHCARPVGLYEPFTVLAQIFFCGCAVLRVKLPDGIEIGFDGAV